MKEGTLKAVTRGQSCSHELSTDYVVNFVNRKKGCVPVGFSCKNYAMFKSGKCFDCGDDGSKCAPATYESMEYSKNFPNPNSNERLFFDTSPNKKNFCRKHSRIVSFFEIQPLMYIIASKLSVHLASVSLQHCDQDEAGRSRGERNVQHHSQGL